MRRAGRRVKESKKTRFGLVGVINTIVDIGILNLLVIVLNVPLIPSNIASTTSAMIVSFTLNKQAVFRSKGNTKRQVFWFFVVTLAGVWGVQTSIVALLHPLLSEVLPSVISLLAAKVVGISVGLIWNYLWYSRFVFRSHDNQEK